jgi:RHS repeat-associated protein
MAQDSKSDTNGIGQKVSSAPSISLPKGGGAIRGIGEKFAASPVTGTGSMSVPIATSPGRSGFGPQLSLSYDSGAGNGPFGFGWSLSLPAITRKTDKGLPQYDDANESDVYILSGAEDLVPVLEETRQWQRHRQERVVDGVPYRVERYRPRIEGLFARIERWTELETGEVHWRSISRDNITTLYGKDNGSRIFDPADPDPQHPTRIFSWLICESRDDKGNAIVYEYAAENSEGVDPSQAHEANRTVSGRSANRYLKRITSGNRVSHLVQPDLSQAGWMFEVVFDYGEGHYEEVDLDPSRPEDEQHRFTRASASVARPWAVRPDPFSSHRAGFDVRTYRRCARVLMFHHIPDLPTGEKGYDGLVRATEFDYADLDYTQPVTIEEELAHQGSTRFASFIRAVRQSGYVRDDTQPVIVRDGVEYATYLEKSLPPLEFEYSKAAIQDELLALDAGSLENLPAGLDGSTYEWVDLDGEGVSGILTEQAGAWFYKPNLGDGRLGPIKVVAPKPSVAELRGGRQQLLDLAGDGQLDVVTLAGPTPGFYERSEDEGWEPFRPFGRVPNIPWNEPNLRFVDLDGDGHTDVLITEQDVFTWHPSLAEEGFGQARRVTQPVDEERGPRLVFADGTQSVYLADMCGDGLTDLVRVRNGEVCYWPNLGYGCFGAKIAMDNAPWFDSAEQFDQRRVRLADIDGSGTNDIIYLGRDGARLYFNQSGNRLSEARRIAAFPHVDDVSSVVAADLLGNGTACLVWSSPLPSAAGRPLCYVDLMGGMKPHLLIGTVNNLGAETRVEYAPSTRFYLADKRAGKPWVTRLPFPVQVVVRAETVDRISGNRFITRSAYHHGYFDGVEREFRGFGMVDQWDTEEFATLNVGGAIPNATNIDGASHVPPVLTKTWFHTGAYVGRNHVSDFFAGLLDENDQGEYYREPGLTDEQARALLLDDTTLPDGLTADEEREACRALKGSMLRQEVYALDGTEKQDRPYTVTEQSFAIRVVQPRGANRFGVFFAHAREALGYHYERELVCVLAGQIVGEDVAHTDPQVRWLPDPRVTHALTIAVDEFGNVLRSAAVGYGRRYADLRLPSQEDRDKQTKTLVTYTENGVTNAIDVTGASAQEDAHRTPLPCEARTYELTGLMLAANSSRFSLGRVDDAGRNATPLDYEQELTAGQVEKRLIEHVRTCYRADDLTGPLPLGVVEPRALPFESYQLAFTPGLVAAVYGNRVGDDMLEDEAGYVHTDGDVNWWIPSGRIFYSPGPADTPAQELAYARQHFLLPHRYRDPFHTAAVSTESFVTYDAYDLLMEETRDALGNRVTVGERNRFDPNLPLVRRRQDYRLLQPALAMDPNRNRSEVAFDTLGMVVAMAALGKPEEVPVPGDRITPTLRADLTPSEIDAFLAELDALPARPAGPVARALLDDATTRFVYDLTSYRRSSDSSRKSPAVAVTLARETHASEPAPADGLRIQVALAYSDGFGREIQKKAQAEPGPLPVRDATGAIIVDENGQPRMTPDDVSPRWVGSGWTVFNNKGEPVRQFEPFFTDTARFDFDVRIGVSPVLFYDPVERMVATLHPNHTWEKVVFDPWRQERWDVNDTARVTDPRTDPYVGEFFDRLPSAEFLPTWHALRTDPAHAAAASIRWPDARTRAAERRAAEKTTVHAGTPIVTHADSLGRTFLTVTHNRSRYREAAPTESLHETRVVLDIEGNQREVIDAKGRVVMRYEYDMPGNRVHQASIEAGERWMLNDVAGKPLYAWDSRAHRFETRYDALRRPTASLLREVASPTDITVGEGFYGESRPNPEADNLRGKVVEVRDQAGVVVSDDYDFKGNLLSSSRQVAREYRTTVNWSATVPLEGDPYVASTRYDALNRALEMTAPDGSVVRPSYNEAGLLESIEANLRGEAVVTRFVDDIDYDAKGQRTLIRYGNGVRTTYDYDPLTSRLERLLSRRRLAAFPDDCTQPSVSGWPGCHVQDLHHTYDPAGNITTIRDDAQQTIYFRNKRVDPDADYTYDAIYRLIEATGREHLGQAGGSPSPHSYNDVPRVGVLHPSDGKVMGRYLEQYVYDEAGNFEEMIHRGIDPEHPGWRRVYAYNEASQLEPIKVSNRLTSTAIGQGTEAYSTGGNGYDAHGNMLRMPHLQVMKWDFSNQLQLTRRQAVGPGDADGAEHNGERTWYVYDGGGQRVRKVTELPGGQVRDERVYLGGFEIYRRRGANALVRETLHVMDDRQRVALVETRTAGDEPGVPRQRIRYEFGNHLGSASLELNQQARIVSYEEYTPYGSTSYQAVASGTEAPKRYRYAGMERDEESGLAYHGARSYAPWIGRWVSVDPKEGSFPVWSPYCYSFTSPIGYVDPDGSEPTEVATVTAYHKTSARQARGMAKAGITNIASRWHAWLGTGFYTSSSSNISTDVARGDTIISLKIRADTIVDLTTELGPLYEDSASGKDLRSATSGTGTTSEGHSYRAEKGYRKAKMGEVLRNYPDKTIAIRMADGTTHYIVRSPSAIVGKPESVGPSGGASAGPSESSSSVRTAKRRGSERKGGGRKGRGGSSGGIVGEGAEGGGGLGGKVLGGLALLDITKDVGEKHYDSALMKGGLFVAAMKIPGVGEILFGLAVLDASRDPEVHEASMSFGEAVERATGSRVAGAIGAANAKVVSSVGLAAWRMIPEPLQEGLKTAGWAAKNSPGSFFTGGIATPFMVGRRHCFAGMPCSYRENRR